MLCAELGRVVVLWGLALGYWPVGLLLQTGLLALCVGDICYFHRARSREGSLGPDKVCEAKTVLAEVQVPSQYILWHSGELPTSFKRSKNCKKKNKQTKPQQPFPIIDLI